MVLFPLTHNNILDPFHFIKIDTNKYILINVVNRLHRSKSAYFEESVVDSKWIPRAIIATDNHIELGEMFDPVNIVKLEDANSCIEA